MSEEARLRWRCRRGMRELDQLLGWYLDARYGSADDAQKAAFSTLLEQQDPDLWIWLSGRDAPPEPRWKRIVDEIRTRDRV
ncbi:MAG TPA: succinate dehydrogenase assembly factor 2 [Rudaea sp.]|jgi:antitoxin CptB|nr:succinate dehydrogenase assembly factor 2 [Rudaea sp.]